MLETYFSASKMLGHLRSGPSGRYLDGFAAVLERQGYSAGTAVRYLRAAAHLGHVVARQGAVPSDIDLAVFSEHLRTCRCPRAMGGRRNHHTIYGGRLFRQHLVEIGVCRSAAAVLQHAEPCLVAHFKVWLRKHRGASDSTIKLYARDAAQRVLGKGQRERMLPLWKTTAAALRAWLAVRGRIAAPEVFVNARGEPLSRWGFAYLLKQHAATAARGHPDLVKKRISPHGLRHTCAMIILQATQDIRKVSLWLGHATLTTTEIYTRGDPTEKLDALQSIV